MIPLSYILIHILAVDPNTALSFGVWSTRCIAREHSVHYPVILRFYMTISSIVTDKSVR